MGDSMTQIADDELMRIQKIGEALAGLQDKKVVDARQAGMLKQLDERSERRAGPKVQHQARGYAAVT